VISTNLANHPEGLTLRPALIAGLGYLMPVAYAEFSIWPRLVFPATSNKPFKTLPPMGALCCRHTLLSDHLSRRRSHCLGVLCVACPGQPGVVIVDRVVQVVDTVIALFGRLNLVTVHRLLNTPDSSRPLGPVRCMSPAENDPDNDLPPERCGELLRTLVPVGRERQLRPTEPG